MKVFIILLIFLPLFSFAQNMDKIDESPEVAGIFENIVGKYEFQHFYAQDQYTKELKTLTITKDLFCLNSGCRNINSPIYYLFCENKDEYNFCFRLSDGTLCIIVVVNERIDMVEILPAKSKTHIILANRNVN